MRVTGFACEVLETDAGISLSTSWGAPPARRRHVLVRLSTDDGLTGFGEATPLPRFTGETVDTIRAVLEREWLPMVVGRDPHDLPAIHAELSEILPGNTSARAAVDVALHDILAQAEGVPLYKRLGHHGQAELRRTYAIGVGPIDSVVAEAVEWCARGYGTIKLKVGTDAREDVERVLEVRAAIPPETRLRIDANAGYDLKAALWVLRKLEGADIELAEQLTPAHDVEAWRAVRARSPIPLMADESLQSAADAFELAAGRLADYVVIKLIKTGGISNAQRIAAIAATAGIECIVSTPFDTLVGAAAAMHVAFALGSADHSHDIPPLPIEGDQRRGYISAPVGPGLGVTTITPEEASWAAEAVTA